MFTPAELTLPQGATWPSIRSSAAWYARWKPFIIEVSALVLAISASMILGMLSFCGMLALWPLGIIRACISFVLAIAYEGEIYLQNIRGSLEKLTTPGIEEYERQMTGLYLQEKLARFDHNRNRLLITEPTDEDKIRVCQFNEVLIIRNAHDYQMGFRNQSGVYEQKSIDINQTEFLKSYSSEQFIENQAHNQYIHAVYQKLYGSDAVERSRENYPLLISIYLSQREHVEQWTNYLRTQPFNEEHQNILNRLNEHVQALEKTMIEHLFHQNTPVIDIEPVLGFKNPNIPMINSSFDFRTMHLTNQPIEGIDFDNLPVGLEQFNKKKLKMLSKYHYNFHSNELKKWISAEDRQHWRSQLGWHTLYSRLAIAASLFAGIVMGLGTTYLITESFASMPLLAAISLSAFPGIIVPLALIAGGAYGLLIYNSMTDMLLNNPFTKFFDRMRANTQNTSLKSKLMLGVTTFLFLLTMLLTYCTIGTWLTIFHQHKPLFALMSLLPKVILNIIIPAFIGLSILPFSIQSIANTLDNIEEDPSFNHFIDLWAKGNLFNTIWEAIPKNAAQRDTLLWKYLIPKFLGVSAEEFAQETIEQKWNPYRILLRLLFEPLEKLLFTGHLYSAAVTGDQVEGLSKFWSLVINGGFELVEDYDYLYPNHVHRRDASAMVKNSFQGSDDHNHDNTIPLRLLKYLFDPLIRRAAQWDYDYDAAPIENRRSVQQRYETLQGLKPHTAAPNIPKYRTQANHKLFLFKSGMATSVPLKDLCCTQVAMPTL